MLLPGDLWHIKKTRDEMHDAVEFMMKRLEERKKAFKPEVTNDYIDFFLHRNSSPSARRTRNTFHRCARFTYCTHISEVTATSGTEHSTLSTR